MPGSRPRRPCCQTGCDAITGSSYCGRSEGPPAAPRQAGSVRRSPRELRARSDSLGLLRSAASALSTTLPCAMERAALPVLFERALASGRLHSAYLISGPRDAAREAAARVRARERLRARHGVRGVRRLPPLGTARGDRDRRHRPQRSAVPPDRRPSRPVLGRARRRGHARADRTDPRAPARAAPLGGRRRAARGRDRRRRVAEPGGAERAAAAARRAAAAHVARARDGEPGRSARHRALALPEGGAAGRAPRSARRARGGRVARAPRRAAAHAAARAARLGRGVSRPARDPRPRSSRSGSRSPRPGCGGGSASASGSGARCAASSTPRACSRSAGRRSCSATRIRR